MSVRDIAALLEAGVECIAIGVRQYNSLAQVLRLDVVAMALQHSLECNGLQRPFPRCAQAVIDCDPSAIMEPR